MDSMWERVLDYININRTIAEVMMSQIKSEEKIKGLSLIKKGLRNSNYIVDYDNSKFLLRIYGVNDDWWEKEKAVYDYAKDKVKVPELLYFDGDLNIINKPFAVFEYIEGMTLDEYIIKGGDCSGIMNEIGRGLAKIHSHSYNEVGFFGSNLEIEERLPPIGSWYDLFLTEKTTKKLGDRLSCQVRKYVEDNAANIGRMEDKITFIHNDFRPINIIIDKKNDPYFIDWEGSMSGPMLGDIGQFLRFEEQITPENEKLFINGYNEVSADRLPDDYKELGKLRDLANLLQMLDSSHSLQNKDRDLINIIKNTCCKQP